LIDIFVKQLISSTLIPLRILIESKRKIEISNFIFVLSFIHLFAWIIYLVVVDDSIRITYIPDDGFYYLTLSKNYLKYFTWTFDSGITKTTGFHLLYAYVLVGIIWISGEIFLIEKALFTSLVFVIVLYYFVWRLYKKIGDRNILLVCALLFSSINVFYNVVALVEWPIVVILSFIYIMLGLNIIKIKYVYPGIVYMCISLMGTLARTEFILVPTIIFFIVYILSK